MIPKWWIFEVRNPCSNGQKWRSPTGSLIFQIRWFSPQKTTKSGTWAARNGKRGSCGVRGHMEKLDHVRGRYQMVKKKERVLRKWITEGVDVWMRETLGAAVRVFICVCACLLWHGPPLASLAPAMELIILMISNTCSTCVQEVIQKRNPDMI